MSMCVDYMWLMYVSSSLHYIQKLQAEWKYCTLLHPQEVTEELYRRAGTMPLPGSLLMNTGLNVSQHA